MATFIATWNGSDEGWPTYEADRAAADLGNRVERPWSFRNRGVLSGDRVFMLRQRDNRGLIASGTATSAVYSDRHWDPARADKLNYAVVRWDTILPISDRILHATLCERIRGYTFSPQSSGTRLSDEIVPALEQLWAEHLRALGRPQLRTTATHS